MLMLEVFAAALPPFNAPGVPMAIPEASSLALLIVGLTAVGVAARRRQVRCAAESAASPTKAVEPTDSGALAGQVAAR